ncbi:Uncharacterized protein PBTT_05242 [Plasmodiophora brassicae]
MSSSLRRVEAFHRASAPGRHVDPDAFARYAEWDISNSLSRYTPLAVPRAQPPLARQVSMQSHRSSQSMRSTTTSLRRSRRHPRAEPSRHATRSTDDAQIASLKAALVNAERRSHRDKSVVVDFNRTLSKSPASSLTLLKPSSSSTTTTPDADEPVADVKPAVDPPSSPMTPAKVGWADQQRSWWRLRRRQQRRYLVLRQTCLEIYDTPEAFACGRASGCVLLVGCVLTSGNGAITLRFGKKAKRFRTDDWEAWSSELRRAIARATPDSQFTNGPTLPF